MNGILFLMVKYILSIYFFFYLFIFKPQNPSNSCRGQLENNSLSTGSTSSQGIHSTSEDLSDAEPDISQASSSQQSEQSSATSNNQAARSVFTH